MHSFVSPLFRASSRQLPAKINCPSVPISGQCFQTSMRLPKIILYLAVCFISSVLVGQQKMFDPGTQAICQQVKDVAVPSADLPTAEEKKDLAGCRSQDLYFGLGATKDPVKARKCAFAEIDRGVSDLDIAGRAILAMLYANAQGVDRNLDLAMKFSCEVQGSPGDVAGNIHELARFKEAKYNGTNFSFCDHSSGRHLYEQCVALDDRFDKIKREARLADITKSWSPENKRAFAELRKAADAFFTDRCGSEFGTETTQVQERAFLENDFIARLQQLERGEFPKFTAADLQKSETRLNDDLGKIQAKGSIYQGQITAQGVNKTEKAWQAYKNAWIAFGRKKYPNVQAVSWQTWFTEDRAVMLEKML